MGGSTMNVKDRFVAVIPTDRELQVDLDSPRALELFKRRIRFFRHQVRTYPHLKDWKFSVYYTRSRSGNRHATIKLSQRMTVCERITAQILLGDDAKRGVYNFFRYLNGSRWPILLYEKRKP
jgi:hypothetical protein